MSDLKTRTPGARAGRVQAPAAQPDETAVPDELELTYATGLEVQARSQWA